ncbi:MAG: hypothetical protein E4G94_00220 [ANME-2 cluster archaeon]|nr:MAG: hypothetical protein E4G94_00220 [ANME-2 cluster archaeon]
MATYLNLSADATYQPCVLELNREVNVMEDKNDSEKIVLQGTVTEIRPMQGSHPHLKWLVSLQVNSVIVGDFVGQTFSFNIHSPIKSGIVNGGQYVIQIERIQTGEYMLKDLEPYKGQK